MPSVGQIEKNTQARMKESQHIEWKEAWRDDYLRWICGFANAEAGTLVIGRNDRGEVDGPATDPLIDPVTDPVEQALIQLARMVNTAPLPPLHSQRVKCHGRLQRYRLTTAVRALLMNLKSRKPA